MINRHKTSRDKNHAKVKQALERAGALVHDTAGAGDGFPDLCVWAPRLRRFRLVEIKDGDEKRDDLTPHQVKFHNKFRHTGDLVIVANVDEAALALGLEPDRRRR